MKHYRNCALECENYRKSVNLWDKVSEELAYSSTMTGLSSIIHAQNTWFDAHYKELFWAHNTNPRPTGRKKAKR